MDGVFGESEGVGRPPLEYEEMEERFEDGLQLW